ncbi:hypothetical protein TNCV_1539321 [Trichonephila clavipes]|nr:hypothetical protein TNCV_1539321 [Trichonephila clavipes]
MPNGSTSRACCLAAAGSLRVTEPLAFETTQRVRKEEENCFWIIRRLVWQGLPQIQQPVFGLRESPRSAMDPIQAPPELQDRRDYTPAIEQPGHAG